MIARKSAQQPGRHPVNNTTRKSALTGWTLFHCKENPLKTRGLFLVSTCRNELQEIRRVEQYY